MIEALFKYNFLQNAVLSSLLASIICGIIGVIVVEKKLVMMSGGIAHTAYGGVGLGYLIGFEPMFGAILFAVASAFGIGYVHRKGGVYTDIMIALLWSLGMALGIAFIGFMPGYPPDLNSYLFGNILTVTRSDLYMMVLLTVIVVFVIITFFNDWKSFLFDSRFATILGMKTCFMEYLLLVLIALTAVVLMRVAGIILVIALLTAPAACASLLSDNLKLRMILASGLGALFCLSGLLISYKLGIASGATIIILSVLVYAVLFTVYILKRRRKEKEGAKNSI